MIWLLGIGRMLSRALSAAWEFIRTHPALCAVIALCALSGWLWHGKNGALAERDRARHQITLEITAHRQSKLNYRTAQQQAQQMETARLVRVTAEQKRITADVSSDYATRLADLRARYDRMQRDEKARACAFGASCDKYVPGTTDAAGRTYAAPGDSGFSLRERFVASAQAEQLDALISWVSQQVAVPVN